jgi:hypothetical protein
MGRSERSHRRAQNASREVDGFLSSKGLLNFTPQRVLVWNDVQKDEAIDLHDLPADRIVVTGSVAREQASSLYVRRLDRPADGFRYEQVGSSPRVRLPKR